MKSIVEKARKIVTQLYERNMVSWNDLDREVVFAIQALNAEVQRMEALAQPEQEPVAHPFEDKSVISSLSWAAGLIEQAYRASGGHNGADSWLMNYADKQGERIRQADHREWEKVNGRWQVKVTPPPQRTEQEPPFSVQQAYAMAQVCLDLHEALGCKWGDNPYLTITALQEALAQPVQQKPVAKKKHEPKIDLGKYAGTYGGYTTPEPSEGYLQKAYQLANELRSHLSIAPAQRTEQEPVQYKCTVVDNQHPSGIPLEQWAKPQRTWVGLTTKEKHEIRYSHMTSAEFIEFIEAKLKEKNT